MNNTLPAIIFFTFPGLGSFGVTWVKLNRLSYVGGSDLAPLPCCCLSIRMQAVIPILLTIVYLCGCSGPLISDDHSVAITQGGVKATPSATGGRGGSPQDGGWTTSGINRSGGMTVSGETIQAGSSNVPTREGGVTSGGRPETGGSIATSGCRANSVVGSIKLGWNLGNSLDSIGGDETKWGNPKVTPTLIQAVAKAGFGAVRIPVTWFEHIGPAPDYTIDSAWISRVEEIVKFVIDQGLYAILNVHHDGVETLTGPWILLQDKNGQVTAANNAKVLNQFKKIWAQIADRFKNFNDHLLFESMNEIKVGYGPPKPDYYTQINALNQAFVDTVRASRGTNQTRCLVVPGYNTNIEYTLAGFVAPKDASPGKIILSVHYYDPWNYAGLGKTKTWGAGSAGADNWGQEDWVRSNIQKLKSKYIDNGIPIIWGEYGAVHQAGFENYRRYYMEYVTKAAHDAGIAPFFWDNGSTSSGEEAFGMFSRQSNTILHPAILDAMLRAVNSSYSLANIAKP